MKLMFLNIAPVFLGNQQQNISEEEFHFKTYFKNPIILGIYIFETQIVHCSVIQFKV